MAIVEEDIEPLASGELALAMLGRDTGFAPAEPGGLPAGFELIEDFAHVSPNPYVHRICVAAGR